MLEMICKIPENIEWVLLGAVGTLCVVTFILLSKAVVEMIQYRIAEKEFWKECHCDESEE